MGKYEVSIGLLGFKKRDAAGVAGQTLSRHGAQARLSA
jgi:hypothetical protein